MGVHTGRAEEEEEEVVAPSNLLLMSQQVTNFGLLRVALAQQRQQRAWCGGRGSHVLRRVSERVR